MKFRLVWMGPEDDPDPSSARRAGAEQPLPRARPSAATYERRDGEMVRREQRESGRVKLVALANFTARIVRDVILDDDAEQRREFGLEADMAGQKVAFVVSAAEFGRMDWVLRELGPTAIVYPGQQQHVRAAIQSLSGAIGQERLYTHLGWRKHGADWVYLQAGGAVAAEGTVVDVKVRLPVTLEQYQVRPPGDRDQLREAVRSSLDFLSAAPDRISLPLLAAVYRAPLGGADFSVFLNGRSGAFKTALAALCQQHFGAGLDARHLPGHFSSTANALEELAFQAKDALLVIDDFAPTGGTGDPALEALAERLFRAAGNRQGRNRMRGRQVPAPHPPRALLLATGEQVPRGHSLRARLLIVELRPGEVDRVALTRCQAAAEQGRFATAMGGYLAWIARDYESLRDRLRARSRELRSDRMWESAHPVHARLPGMLAELYSGWETWLQFTAEVGALSGPERVDLERRCRQALNEVAALQSAHHQADPARRFLDLLRAALMTGRAHLADRKGAHPEFPQPCGWRRLGHARLWVPQGVRIGWVVGNNVFLEPTVSFQLAQQIAPAGGLCISMSILRRQLRAHGLLASIDEARHMLVVRRILEGSSRKVLHLRTADLISGSTESDRRSP